MQRARLCNLILFAVILCLVAGSFLGCSQEKKRKLLTFFFDGVPGPTGIRAAEGEPVTYLHKPYSEGKCDACHRSGEMEMSISAPVEIGHITSAVCLKCHDKVRTAHPVMHGPVAAGECLQCHDPHQSTVAHILIGRPAALCGQCHVPENMKPERPEHKDLSVDCLTCHYGHGGPAHGLLRPKGAATRPVISSALADPATRPVVSSALLPAEGGPGL